MKYKRLYLMLVGMVLFAAASVVNAAEENLTANNVVVVLDASGSMSEKMSGSNIIKMDAAKSALKEVLANVPADTQIGLLVFSDSKANPWRFPLGPRDDSRIRQAVDASAPGGGTPLGEYINIAAKALQQQRKNQMGYGTYRMLVVTDGQASDMGVMRQSVPRALRQGIRMDVIGVDMKKKHTLATQVHSYRRADDPQALKKAVADVFAEVSGGPGSSTTAEAFAEIAPIPSETAGKMLAALTHPVTLSANTQPTPANSGTSSSSASYPQSSSSSSGFGGMSYPFIFIIVIVGIILLKSVAKKLK